MKSICILITLMALTLRTPAQTASAPLQLFINGSGRVFPFHDGQKLEVGRDYTLTAIPDWGYAFTNWQPVNVFTIVQTTVDQYGAPLETVTNTVLSPVPNYSSDPRLRFTIQPIYVLYDNPGVMTLTESEGWQANFVPATIWGGARNR